MLVGLGCKCSRQFIPRQYLILYIYLSCEVFQKECDSAVNYNISDLLNERRFYKILVQYYKGIAKQDLLCQVNINKKYRYIEPSPYSRQITSFIKSQIS